MITDGQGTSSEAQETLVEAASVPVATEHDTLKYHLLGPSLTKAGQDTVDQHKVIAAWPQKVMRDPRVNNYARFQR